MSGTSRTLAAQNASLVEDNCTLFAENNMLRCRLATAKQNNSELKVDLNGKAAENAVLAKKLKEEESENCKLVVENIKLCRKLDALVAANAKLAADLAESRANFDSML